MKTCSFKHSGFTLVEMAIVLVIVGLLLGGMLMPLSAQMEQRRISETQKTLDEITQALIGFAVAKGRLPRPAISATDGAERAACATEAECTGLIPWATLGVSKLDSWGKIIRYSVTLAFAGDVSGTTPFILTSIGTKTIKESSAAVPNLATQIPAVVFSHGHNNWGTGDTGSAFADNSATNVDEDANNTASATFYSRTPSENTAAPGGEFDDHVTWLSPNTLFNRMVAANQLP